jgi:hypothetical protein
MVMKVFPQGLMQYILRRDKTINNLREQIKSEFAC